jgi:hypothetical protein
MAEEEPIIRDAIGYSFPGLEAFPYLEELIKELGLESERYWMRPATREDCFAKGDWVILRQQPNPVLLDEYELQYDIPYDDKNIYQVMFLEYLVDTMLEYIGYLEGCLEKESEEE